MSELGAVHAASSDGDQVVYVFTKNRREEVRASVGEYRGHPVIDVRVWAHADDGSEIPTRKGLTLGVRHVEELLAAAEALAKAVRAA